MENNLDPSLNFDEEKISFLLENADKLPLILSKDQIEVLIDTLKNDVQKMDEIIKELEKQESPE
jgi:uncharacterized membrane protein YvbJ